MAPAARAKVLRGMRAQTFIYTLLHLMGSSGHSRARWGRRGKSILICHLSPSENVHFTLPSPLTHSLPSSSLTSRARVVSELQTFLRKCH